MSKACPILTIMADFGMGPYAWIRNDGDLLANGVGPNMADETGFYHDTLKIHKNLHRDFVKWVHHFEKSHDDPAFNWAQFHEVGLDLAHRLKAKFGDRAIVRYAKPWEDPDHADNTITVIE